PTVRQVLGRTMVKCSWRRLKLRLSMLFLRELDFCFKSRTAMNQDDAARPITSSNEPQHEAPTHLHGRWLWLSRIVWFALVALTLSVSIANLPEYVTTLQTVCRLAPCPYGQLSADMAVALEHFGLSVSSYALFMFALATLLALVCFTAGFVLFWR